MAWIVEGGYMLVNRVMCGSVSGYARGGVAESGRELVRMVVGKIVSSLKFLVSSLEREVSSWKFLVLGVVIVALGSHLLELELAVRRSLGISVYTLGAPYPELKSRVLAKYRSLPSGTPIPRPPMETEDYMILALRPDLKPATR